MPRVLSVASPTLATNTCSSLATASDDGHDMESVPGQCSAPDVVENTCRWRAGSARQGGRPRRNTWQASRQDAQWAIPRDVMRAMDIVRSLAERVGLVDLSARVLPREIRHQRRYF